MVKGREIEQNFTKIAKIIKQVQSRQPPMQISLTQNADRLLERMMTLGYTDPADIIEVALERMVSELSDQESPELLAWFQSEVAIGADEADAGEFSTLTLDDIKAQVLAAHTSKSV